MVNKKTEDKMNKQKLIATIRAVPISGRTYEEYVEAVASRLYIEGARPLGQWEEENRLRRSAKFLCSVCGELAYYPQPTRDEAWQKCCPYKYCPNCGSAMRAITDKKV